MDIRFYGMFCINYGRKLFACDRIDMASEAVWDSKGFKITGFLGL